MGKGPLFRIFVAVVCIKQVKIIEKTRQSVAVICLLMFVNNVGSSIYFLTDFLQKSRRAPAISRIALSHMENMNFVVVSVLHRTEVNDGSTVRRWLKFVRNLVCGMNPGRLASDKD